MNKLGRVWLCSEFKTRWKRNKTRDIEADYKLIYVWSNKKGLWREKVIMDKNLRDNAYGKNISRVITIKIVLEHIVNIVI